MVQLLPLAVNRYLRFLGLSTEMLLVSTESHYSLNLTVESGREGHPEKGDNSRLLYP